MRVEGLNKKYGPAPEGTFVGCLLAVRDLGEQETAFGRKLQWLLTWVIPEKDSSGYYHQVWQRINPSLGKKSRFYQLVLLLTGEPPCEGLDSDELLNRNVRLVIKHNESDGKVFANVTEVLPMRAEDQKFIFIKGRLAVR